MASTWATIASTWDTETAQWNAFPTDYLYSGTLNGIFGSSSTVVVDYVAPVTGAVGVFGVASTISQNNEAIYAGSLSLILSVAFSDLDILTWTPRAAASGSWTEQDSL